MAEYMGRRAEAHIAEEVEREIGTGVICERCGATLATFSDQCMADLVDRCPGFERIDAVWLPIAKRVYRL